MEGGGQNSASYSQCPSPLILKILLGFPPSPGRMENKKYYRSLRLLNIFKSVLQIMILVLGLYKKLTDATGFPHNLVLLFQVENVLHGKKRKHRIFLVLYNWFSSFLHHVFGKKVFINKNYLDDLDVIDQGHNKDNV